MTDVFRAVKRAADDRDRHAEHIDVVSPVNKATSLDVSSPGSHQVAFRRQHAPISQRRRDESSAAADRRE